LTITTTVDNYPGFPNGTGGMKLMMDMMNQFKNLNGEIKSGLVKKISDVRSQMSEGPKETNFEVEMENGETLHSKAVIVATGAAARWLGLPGEKELIGHGISGCATCDGMFFRGKVVAVVGGGDVAAEDAEFMSKFATKVYMIHRRDSLRAQIPQQKLVLNNPKIEMIWNTEVVGINSKQDTNSSLQDIKVKNNKTGEEKILEVGGMFVAIGRDAATGFVKDLVKTNEIGQIATGMDYDFRTMTSVPGIFAAGDCTQVDYRQAIVAAGDGCRAGLDAEKWIANQESLGE
jgi:thioredoxin reductase (NADPH)